MIVTRVMGQFEWLFFFLLFFWNVQLGIDGFRPGYHNVQPGRQICGSTATIQQSAILALGNNTEHVISYEMPVEIAS
jgi:hypothetical protein